MRMPKITLRRFNHGLTVLVALIALYIVLAPFLPQVTWWARHEAPLIKKPTSTSLPSTSPEAPAIEGDKLVIPRLDMQETVYGGGMEALRKGVWRLPHTSTPDKDGNTVLVGHRFTYSGEAVFYHLDKVEVGDPIGLNWHDVFYKYRVVAIKVVPATEVSIEADTTKPRLTIYTCTPLLTAKDRLVIQAEPVKDAS